MKFSGKQLFEMWWDVVGQSVNWNREIDEEQRSHWDALAEKLNAMLPQGVVDRVLERPPLVIESQFIEGTLLRAPIIDEEAMRRLHLPPPAVCFCNSCMDDARAKHPNTHTRSCREKMERGESCSC